MKLRPVLLSLATVSLAITWASAHEDEDGPAFKLVNAGARVIRAAHVSAATEATWGPNLLKGDPLEPGESVLIRFSGPCDERALRLVAQGRAEHTGMG